MNTPRQSKKSSCSAIKIYLVPLIIVIFSFEVLPQTGWGLIQQFSSPIQTIVFKDSLNGFLASRTANSNIRKTTDGGMTWNDLVIPNLTVDVNEIIFRGDLGLGVGNGGTIIVSTDGGENWTVKSVGDNSSDLYSAAITNNGNWFAASGEQKIFRSTDSGLSWSSQTIDVFTIKDMSFASDSIGFIVGQLTATAKTTDAGNSWVVLPAIIPETSMFGIQFVSSTVGYVAGGAGIMKTTNGGITWVRKLFNPMFSPTSFSCIGEDLVWAIYIYTIYKSTNGGQSWQTQSHSPTSALLRIHAVDSKTAYMSAEYGRLFKTTGGGVGIPADINEDGLNTKEITLCTNYPNPFNPETVIRFNLPSAGQVTIKVFDILGRLVSTLLNDVIPSGEHKITFNAHDLPSGTYTYQLQSGNVLITRKMILLR